MRIAMISEHASPLAALGGADAGGQNAHVAELVRRARRRRATRCGSTPAGTTPDLPAVVPLRRRVDGRARAGRAGRPVLPKDDLLPYMGDVRRRGWPRDWRDDDWLPDVAHAHFWMSGLAAVTAGAAPRRAGGADLPRARLGQAPPPGRRRTPARPRRVAYERQLGRARRPGRRAVPATRSASCSGWACPRSRMALVPSGVNTDRFRPDGPAAAATPRPAADPDRGPAGRAQGLRGRHPGDAARCPDAELRHRRRPARRPARRRPVRRGCARSPSGCGVADRVRLAGAVPAAGDARAGTARPTCWSPRPGTSRSA